MLDHTDPLSESLFCLGQRSLRIDVRPVVGKTQEGRMQLPDSMKLVDHQLRIEVGRGCDRLDEVGVGKRYSHRISDKAAARFRVVVDDVVLGMPGGVKHIEATATSQIDHVIIVHDEQTIFGDRLHWPPQALHALLAVDPSGRCQKPRGIDQVGGPEAMHADSGTGKPTGQVTGTPGVIEVDVGHDDGGQVVDAERVEPVEKVLERGRWTTLDEGGIRGVEQVAGKTLRLTVHTPVDEIQIVAEESGLEGHSGSLEALGYGGPRPGGTMAEEYPFVPYAFERLGPDEILARAEAFDELMNERRSVRNFSPEPVPRRLIELAVHTASSAPSGAHRQPWKFVVVGDRDTKAEIRRAAETEERKNYEEGRMSEEWRRAVAPLGTDWHKPFLETAPWLVVVFEERYDIGEDGSRRHNYYTKESVGMACGLFVAAIHYMGLVTLTHTPSPMRFLTTVLNRPENERPFALFPVGFPADGCLVPDLQRKPLGEVMVTG